jgi:hypothetical protein
MHASMNIHTDHLDTLADINRQFWSVLFLFEGLDIWQQRNQGTYAPACLVQWILAFPNLIQLLHTPVRGLPMQPVQIVWPQKILLDSSVDSDFAQVATTQLQMIGRQHAGRLSIVEAQDLRQ